MDYGTITQIRIRESTEQLFKAIFKDLHPIGRSTPQGKTTEVRDQWRMELGSF
jgi:hypothetical protein